jgi:hypothetical protein
MSRLLPHLPALHAVSADLSATLGGNSFAGREPSLAYHARIKLAPFDIDGAAHRIKDAIEQAIAAEREECAKLAEQTICDKHIPTGVSIYGTRAAKAIRARGNT